MSATVDKKTGFELFLEGIKVPFSSITIQENEGSFPQASFSMAATNRSTQILEGTVVQVFGPTPEGKKVLLFEGEVNSISYQKGSQGRVVSYQCSSIFRHFNKARVRPNDAMVSRARAVATGAPSGGTDFVFTNNSSIGGPKSNKSYRELLDENLETFNIKDTTKESLKNIALTTQSPFIIAFTRLMSAQNEDGKKIAEGELNKLIDFFLRYFELNSVFYGMISRSFRIPESIFGWPNSSRFKSFKNKMILNKSLKAMSRMGVDNSGSSARLIGAIQRFMEITRYQMVFPSAPTYAQQFWTGSTDRGPNRGNFMPSMDHSPPAMCNVFYPDQVTSFSYQRPMMQEPTRAVGTYTVFGSDQRYAEKGLTPMAYTPRMELTKEAIENNKLMFTEEESYRGINPMVINLSYFLSNPTIEALRNKDKEEDDTGTVSLELSEDMFHFGSDIDIPELNGAGDSLQQMTTDKYLQAKYEGRMLTAEVEWSPYRMAGLPGMIVETNGPSIAGVVSSVTTQIDSNGSATSSVSFRAPRMIHDEKNIGQAQSGTEDGLFQHVINSFSRDGYLDTNYFLYDPELYNFTNIGADLYNFLVYGDGSEYGNKMNEEGSAEGFSDEKSEINEMDTSPVKDASILNLLKDEDGNIQSSLVEDGDPAETRYAKIIVEALRSLKSQYRGIRDRQSEDMLKQALGRLNFRRLTSKTQYFDYLGVALEDSMDRVEPSEYKDSKKLFSDLQEYIKVSDLIEKDDDNLPSEVNELLEEREGLVEERDKLQQEVDKVKNQTGRGLQGYTTYIIRDYAKEYWNKLESQEKKDNFKQQIRDDFYATRAEDSKGPLEQEIDKLQKRIDEIDEEVDQILASEDESLESEAFKLYNLIRRAHVELMLTDIESVGSVDVIKND